MSDDLVDGLLEGAAEVAGGAVEIVGELPGWAWDTVGDLIDGGADTEKERRRKGGEEGGEG